MLKGLLRGIDSFMGCDRNDLDVEIKQRFNILGFFPVPGFWYGVVRLPNHRLSG